MANLKVINEEKLKDWAKDIFKKNSFNMIDVSSKKETFRRALASGKIYVGKKVFNLIKNKEMPKGDPVTLAEVSAVLGVKKTSELIPLCHPLPIDHTATKIIMHEDDSQKDELVDLIINQLHLKKESHYLELGDTGITPNLSSTGG